MLQIIFLFIFTYLVSAIPFGLIVSNYKGVNLRKIGSGNIGATNVYRALGFKWAALVFALDAFKGALPLCMTILLFPQYYLLHVFIAITAILGHTLSVFAQFKGGKGAATGLGVLLILSPPIFLITALIAFIIIFLSRTISIGTISCCVLLPFLFYFFKYPPIYIFFVGLVCLYVIYRHQANVKRIIEGTESKIF
ncbi:MAG: glycerol-3-phosphate 1-O-acyltransferase PlsY [Candidatus Margulisiibacteriota bacterium]|jgi:glycerol-3-phosphate acyltransferase PlsY